MTEPTQSAATDAGARPGRGAGRWGWFLLAVAALAPGVAVVWWFQADDTFISLRYAERLLQGRGLTWNDGERVEGYSNLLWILLCAAFAWPGPDLVAVARGLGIGCTLATFALLVGRFGRTPVAAGAAALLASVSGVAVWAVGGLEGPLVVLSWTAALLALERLLTQPRRGTAWLAGAAAALAAWSRPDGGLLALVAGAVLVIARVPWRCLLAFVTPVGAAVAGQTVFRVVYYGAWLPNTAQVKLHPGVAMLGDGLTYAGHGAAAAGGLLLPAVLGAVALWRRQRGAAVVLAGLAVAWFAYLVVIGGDFFPGWRLLLPGLAPLALLAGHGLAAVRPAVARTIVLAGVAWGLGCGHADGSLARAANERWEHDARRIGRSLRTAFASAAPRLMVDAAGALPFYSQLPCLDALGLCDARPVSAVHAAERQPTSAFAAAHRRSDATWLLGRAPDLAIFEPAPGTLMAPDRGARALVADPRWARDWRCVAWRSGPEGAGVGAGAASALHTPLWVRIDGRAGIRRDAGRIELPAWLFGALRVHPGVGVPSDDAAADQARDAAQLDDARRWAEYAVVGVAAAGGSVALLQRAGVHSLRGLELEAGEWLAEVEPAVSGVRVLIAVGEAAPRPFAPASQVSRSCDLALEVDGAASLPLTVRRVVLRRR